MIKKPKILVIPAYYELHIVPCTDNNIKHYGYYDGVGGIFKHHKNGFASLDEFYKWLSDKFPGFEDGLCIDWSLLASSKSFVEEDGVFFDLRDEWADKDLARAEIITLCDDTEGWFYTITYSDGKMDKGADFWSEGEVLSAANRFILQQQQRRENERHGVKKKCARFISRCRNKKTS